MLKTFERGVKMFLSCTNKYDSAKRSILRVMCTYFSIDNLIVARYYIYTAAKESESYSITAFKVYLKSKLSAKSPSIRASVRF